MNAGANIGVSAFEHWEENADIYGDIALIGDAVDEAMRYIKACKITYHRNISDFRNARYLLEFADCVTSGSTIKPLYIT
jgi:hypothetical protein